MRFARIFATCIVVFIVACGGRGPVAKPIATPRIAQSADDCARAFAAANAFEDAGRTRRALGAIRALPESCRKQPEVVTRQAALEQFLAPPPPFGDAPARTEARKLLVDGNAALAAGNVLGARAAWEKSWDTFHPNGMALIRLGEVTRKSDPVASRRFFERAAADFTSIHDEPQVVLDRAPYGATFHGGDPRMLAASQGGLVAIFQDRVVRAMVGYPLPTHTMNIVDGVVQLDGVRRLDLETGSFLDSGASAFPSERPALAIAAIPDGFRFVNPTTRASLGEIQVKGAETLPAFAGGGGHVWFVPKPVVTTTIEARAIQVLDPTGWHARLAKITTHRSSPELIHASLQSGKVVRHTLKFSCVQSEIPELPPNVSSYSGITDKDHCDEPTAALTSEDGSLSVIRRRATTGSFTLVTGALTVTDFGAKRADLSAPEGKTTNAVALSDDGSKLLWQFGDTTRLYLTKSMTILWESAKLPQATHASFSASADEVALSTAGGIVLVAAVDGVVRSTLRPRLPIRPTAMAGAAGGFAFAVDDAVAFVTSEGVAWASASAPMEALRASPGLDRVLAFGAGRPCQIVPRSGKVVKLPPTAVVDAAFSSDGSKVFLASVDAIDLYDAATGALSSNVKKSSSILSGLLLLGDRIVVASNDELSTYDLTTRATTSIHLESTILRMAASPDRSAYVVLTGGPGGVNVHGYDATGRSRFDVAVHDHDGAMVSGLVAFADHFVIVGGGATAESRSLQTGQTVATPPNALSKPPSIAATTTQLALDDVRAVRITDPLGRESFTLAFLPEHQVMVRTETTAELLGGTPTCRAGALFVPVEVCDGMLTEGLLSRVLTTKLTRP